MGAPVGSRAKRFFDLGAAAAGLVVTSPLLLAAALAIRLTSPGPVLFRARRAGLHGRPFDMLKLRSMRADSPREGRHVTEPADDRVTPVGRIIRRWKIDELPQLWHVLRGEMSIVGPRPESWEIVERYYTPEQRGVLNARPGLVSASAIRWWPSLTEYDPPPTGVSLQDHYVRRHLPAVLAEDLRYVERADMVRDFRIIGQTVRCIALGSRRPPWQRAAPELRP